MDGKSVIIIGAGIAGLSAGSYLQMNGYRTRIFEMWNIPGGVCTSWKRKGYTFDGCIHWLVGTNPAHGFHKLWDELHALKGKRIIDFDVYKTIEYGNGRIFKLYTDLAKLEEEFKSIAPEDEKLIDEFISAAKEFAGMDIPIEKAQELYNFLDYTKFIFKGTSMLRIMNKWGKMSIKDYALKFKSQNIREIFDGIYGSGSEFLALALIMMLSVMHARAAGYPVGGSLEFARGIEKRYLNLGGVINYNSKVKKVLVENGKAVGIQLENGETHNADIVISAADGHYTIFEMLEGKYVDNEINENYKGLPLFPPILQVSLGIDRDFKDMPHSVNFKLDKPITTSDRYKIDRLTVKFYNFDPTLAPKGKTPAVCLVKTEYEYWERLKKENPGEYDSEKKRIADEIIEVLDKKYGNVKSKIEVADVASPLTYVRYTNNWKGSWEGWLLTSKTFGKKMKKTLPGLENFYMIGQWVEPGGGLPPAAMSGRNVTQIICKKDMIFHDI